MHKESWALNLRHDIDIAETVVNYILEHVASLFSDNVSN